ncbi:UDP-N-acetylglucosamine 2-epimerase (hydrolyzing) [bacterium]|nr:UDP-N-acetylglucosamine 2-epimerase (hydrolyzing) [bacterium]
MTKRKICVVTGTRAEYGLLSWLMREIRNNPELLLQTVVTGMHLSPEFGLTYRLIEEDGFNIDSKVEMLISSDTPVGIAKSVGLGVIGFSDTFERLQPDILVLLGDRYEILAAAQAALFFKIPVAHIGGGDSTEGAFDELIRHSLTKMSHLHFVTNELAKCRVVQMGENPDHIYNVGSLGLDYVGQIKLLEGEEFERAIDFTLRQKNLLITFHPVTLDNVGSDQQFVELLTALERLGPDVGLIFTKPNSDTGGRAIVSLLEHFVSEHPHTCLHTSLGQLRYLSAISAVDAVVGNSSSGLYEVPSFLTPTVNIGDRQKGRVKAASVIDCEPDEESILSAIMIAFDIDCVDTINPYGKGGVAPRIVKVLKEISDLKGLLKKHFYEVSNSE